MRSKRGNQLMRKRVRQTMQGKYCAGPCVCQLCLLHFEEEAKGRMGPNPRARGNCYSQCDSYVTYKSKPTSVGMLGAVSRTW